MQAREPKDIVVDGVHRLSPTGISILIVGAGIGGLMSALESWRLGHEVRVVEKTDSTDTLGDTIGMVPSGFATMGCYPTMRAVFEREAIDAVRSVWTAQGTQIKHLGAAPWNIPGVQHAAQGVFVPLLVARPKLMSMLTRQCERLGITIEYSKEAIQYYEEDNVAFVVLKTKLGEVTEAADVIVAADGVGTRSHGCVSGDSVRAVSSGYCVYRGVIPDTALQQVETSTKARFLSLDQPDFRVYLEFVPITSGPAGDRTLIIISPPKCYAAILLDRHEISYAITYKEDRSVPRESWNASASADVVIDKLSGWDSGLVELLRNIPAGSCTDWTLRFRDPQPIWTSKAGRVVQLGDSAHAFLPTSGNGASQACEDALSLARCLRQGGKGHEGVATRVHTKLRFERVSLIQKLGFQNRHAVTRINLEQATPNEASSWFDMPEWIWRHNPAEYALEKFAGAEKSVLLDAPFENTNLPPGYKYEAWTMASETGDSFHSNDQARADEQIRRA
ncbi:unnamed protein product [Clonostachys byssicola]|uniref:FAD-binding domain-containing protein n=1 Tax=Clonostachys byssicola TaxID=160290 RepID=A0A9N9UYP3_9HYPO|nr:unnamed protein product [Clonostachys byssicola]